MKPESFWRTLALRDTVPFDGSITDMHLTLKNDIVHRLSPFEHMEAKLTLVAFTVINNINRVLVGGFAFILNQDVAVISGLSFFRSTWRGPAIFDWQNQVLETKFVRQTHFNANFFVNSNDWVFTVLELRLHRTVFEQLHGNAEVTFWGFHLDLFGIGFDRDHVDEVLVFIFTVEVE